MFADGFNQPYKPKNPLFFMRPRYDFSSRHTGQAKDPRNYLKERSKFPDLTQKVLNEADIIVQVLDAKFTSDTMNKEIVKFVKNNNKQLINVLNKSDLVSKENITIPEGAYVVVSCKERRGIKKLRDTIKAVAGKIKKDQKIIVGVVGYPNTGKSSLINLLIGKSSAGTGSQPGFTKGLQKLKLSQNILLIDSPGVIPQTEYSTVDYKKIAMHAKINARSYSKVKDPESIIIELMKEFPGLFETYYGIEANGDSDILLETLGRRKNMLKKGNEVNFDTTSRIILRDWQEGKIRID